MNRRSLAQNCISLLLLSAATVSLFGCNGEPEKNKTGDVTTFDLPSDNGLGFAKVDSIKNKNMQYIQPSVLKLVIPSGEAVAFSTLFPDPNETAQAVYNKLKDKKRPHSVLDDVLALQINNCLVRKIADCKLRSAFVQWTGFVVGTGDQVVTSFKGLAPAIKANLTFAQVRDMGPNGLKEVNVDLLAYNYLNQTVIDEKLPAQIKSISLQDIFAEDSVVTLKLFKSQANFLRPAAADLRWNETAYIAGYPVKTVDRVTQGAQDSDGERLLFSHGYVDTLPVAYSAVGKDWSKLTSDQQLLVTATVLVVRADATKDMLGAPILNEYGQYVGLMTWTTESIVPKYSFGSKAQSF